MSESAPAPPVGAFASADASETSLLDQILAENKQTAEDRMTILIKVLVEKAQDKTVTFDRNLSLSIEKAIQQIDKTISTQLNEIIHHPRFLELEGRWRGLNYLVKNTTTSSTLKIRVLNANKETLADDFESSVEFDQSHLFKAVYEGGFGVAGGEPFGVMVGDYEWGPSARDVEVLQQISGVAASAFAPFVSAASSAMFGLKDWTQLGKIRDLEQIFETAEYTKWKSFRDTDNARFVSLTLPRMLARLPYGRETKKVDQFNYEETAVDDAHATSELSHGQYCWMNAAYGYTVRLASAFADYGFCTRVRGEDGGQLDDLPLHTFITEKGDKENKCPTEVNITDRREAELGKLGFLPLVHYKDTDKAVFFGAQTVQKPKKYDRDAATANAAISARLPYIMASSRFAHYLKVIGRGRVGSFMEAADCERWLNRWILNYVNTSTDASDELKAKFPLRAAQVTVEEIPGMPGSYNAVALLQPWLQMEELNGSLRMVAQIPPKS